MVKVEITRQMMLEFLRSRGYNVQDNAQLLYRIAYDVTMEQDNGPVEVEWRNPK